MMNEWRDQWKYGVLSIAAKAYVITSRLTYYGSIFRFDQWWKTTNTVSKNMTNLMNGEVNKNILKIIVKVLLFTFQQQCQ